MLLVVWEGDSASILSTLASARRSLPGGGVGVGTPRCQGEWHPHGDARLDQVSLHRSSTESTNAANQLSRCVFGTIKHFCNLPLAYFPWALHQPGRSLRNTVFAQTGSRAGMYGRGNPSAVSPFMFVVDPFWRWYSPTFFACLLIIDCPGCWQGIATRVFHTED